MVMFAEDSGITAFFQLIEGIRFFPFDKTSLTLFYAVDTIVSGLV